MAKKPNPTATIAAVATAPGQGGIGVVRVSGKQAKFLAEKILGCCPSPRTAKYTDFLDACQQPIDCGIALFFPGPNSYTGEDVLELQGHGGSAVSQMVLQRCLQLGARMAEPGEFTQRAWLNDKLDLAQAEAVADLIEASTAQAAKSAMRSLAGVFSQKVHELRDRLIDLRLFIEACLDFPEEDIDFISHGRVAEKLLSVTQALHALSANAQQGRLLRDGIRVVLIGRPNVGKSSLLNQLYGEDVAIVTPVAGTTRDTLRNEIQIEGVPVHVIDTAGLRDSEDEVEREGMLRTWKAVENATVALLLMDARSGMDVADQQILGRLPAGLPVVWVFNKADLLQSITADEQGLFISAKTGKGLDVLRARLLEIAGWQAAGEGLFAARERHLLALQEVSEQLVQAQGKLLQPELLAEHLRLAQESLNKITGEFSSDDLLGEIFSRFCIGK